MANKRVESEESSAIAADQELNFNGFKFGEFGQSRSSPVILTPSNYSVHSAGTHVLLSGTCEANAKVEVYHGTGKFADAVVVGTRWFCYHVWGAQTVLGSEWHGWAGKGAGFWGFFVEQTLDNGSAHRSAVCYFGVDLLLKSPPPLISLPSNGSEIRGGGVGMLGSCAAEATIDLAVNGKWTPDAGAVYDGIWFADAYPHPGTVTLEARQTVPGYLPSDPVAVTVKYVALNGEADASSSLEESTIDPSASPRKPPTPTVDMPAGGSAYPQQWILLSGACEEGASIKSHYGSWGMVIRDARVFGNRWYAKASVFPAAGGGLFPFFITQTLNGATSDHSNVVVIHIVMPPPLIVFPVTESNHPVGGLFMSGVCDKDAAVEILAALDGSSLGHAVVKGTTWVYYREWSRGVKHVMARQTYKGRISGESERIEFTVR